MEVDGSTTNPIPQNQSSAVSLLINHPSLVGFESPSRMLVTCVKELFENAMDACRRPTIAGEGGQESRKIEVILRVADPGCVHNGDIPVTVNVDESGLVPLELIVRDNADGMSKDPEELVQLFASTKARGIDSDDCAAPPTGMSSASSGKFGVGLTASILHSHHIFGVDSHGRTSYFEEGGICQITSRSERCVFSVDRNMGHVACVHRESAESAAEDQLDSVSGTEVRIIVPGGAVAGSAPDQIRTYFQRLALTSHLLNCSITYIEANCLSRARLIFPFQPFPLSSQVPTARCDSLLTRDGALRFFLAREEYFSTTGTQSPYSSVSSLPATRFSTSTRAIDDCRADIFIALHGTLVDTPTTGQEEEVSGSNITSARVPVEVIRLVNHVPLPDSKAAVACGICAALRTLPVVRTLEDILGLKPKGNAQYIDSDAEPCIRFDMNDMTVVKATTTPSNETSTSSSSPSIVLKRPNCPTGLGGGKALRLTVVIDMQGDDLSFGSLDKTYLANQIEYKDAVSAAVVHCLQQLHVKQPNLFAIVAEDSQSKAFEAKLRKQLPDLADALASLVAESDEERVRECLDLLSLPSTHMHEATLSTALNPR